MGNVSNIVSVSTREIRANLTVHGWIRQCCKLKVLIPSEIIKLCVLFYLNQMVFYTEKHGDGLEFNDEENTVTWMTQNTEIDESDRTCLFGVPICAENCDTFDISFKWLESENKGNGMMYMGWISNTIDESINNWNLRFGLYANKKYSSGILGGPYYSNFYVYKDFGHKMDTPNNIYKRLNNGMMSWTHNPKEGDGFKLKFDFVNDKVLVYHNNVLITDTSLDGAKEIIPGLSLTYKGQRIKVIKWEFCKGDKIWS